MNQNQKPEEIIISLPKDEYDFDHCKMLIDIAPSVDMGGKNKVKDYSKAYTYLSNYLVPLADGTYALLEKDEVSIIKKDVLVDVYLNRCAEIKAWFTTSSTPVKLICDNTKPQRTKKYINVSKQFKHEYKAYSTFSDEIKEKVNKMLHFIKEVWASNDEKMYQYLLNWFANITQCIKNSSCLYAKGIQGIGKSTVPDFFREYVIGNDVTTKGKSDHLKGDHNMQLLGRAFVYFEELQIFSEAEWNAIDAELKDMITSERGSYTDKYMKRFAAENINNYMILTNFSLKGVHGRRYCVLEIDSKYLNNLNFFASLRKDCFNDEVGHAFFCYLKEIDVSKFLSSEIPDTQTKLELISELLPPVEKFLKFHYALRKTSIDMKAVELFQEFEKSTFYKSYINLHKFYGYMREIGFNFKCHQGYNRYQIKLEKLKEFGENRKWFSSADIDEVAVELTKKKTTYFEEDDDTHKSNNEKMNENEKMESRIRMLEDFVTMQDSFNKRQRTRYSMDLKFNEAMRE